MSLLNQAIERFDVVEYARHFGFEEMPNGELILSCPQCGKEKLCLTPLKKSWHCWVCEKYGPPDRFGRRQTLEGAGGLVSFVALMEGIPPHAAARRILSLVTFSAEDLATIPAAELRTALLEAEAHAKPIPAPEGFVPITGILPYMLQRGITLEDARMFGLGWCTHGRYRNRLVFPVWERGSCVYFQARAMWAESERPGERYIKALNPSREDGAAVSSDVLFNLDQASRYPRVAVVEGPMDAVKTGPDSVCTFGKKISSSQVAKLLRAGVRGLDFMWDGPSAREPHGAWPEMFAAAPMLSAMFDVRLVLLPSGDPGEKTREELFWHRANARPASSLSRLSVV